jgi:hypothetical protein
MLMRCGLVVYIQHMDYHDAVFDDLFGSIANLLSHLTKHRYECTEPINAAVRGSLCEFP